MKHGAHCNCMMCAVGKKLGMISDEHNHEEHSNNNRNVCKNCSHTHKEDGHCNCGCK